MDSSFLGLVVDTSSLVSAERRKQSVRQIFSQLRASYGEVTIAVPAVTIMELAHGVERAKSQHQKDLIIGTTALHHGCQIVSENVKHFELIPGLAVKNSAYFQTPLL